MSSFIMRKEQDKPRPRHCTTKRLQLNSRPSQPIRCSWIYREKPPTIRRRTASGIIWVDSSGLMMENARRPEILEDSGPSDLCSATVLRDGLPLSSQGGVGFLHQVGESGCVLYSNVSQYLAVEFDAGLLQPVDELRVAGVVQFGGGGDAHDPQ